jgi:hypothetical protein
MNSIITLELLGCSLLGQFIHLLIKAKAIKARNDAAGLSSNPFVELFTKDYINLIISFVVNMALLALIFPKEPKASDYIMIHIPVINIDFSVYWRFALLIFSGYSGSSFFLSLLSKVDKNQKELINQVSVLTPNNMEYVWDLEFSASTDMVIQSGGNISIADYAQLTFGVYDSDKTITYDSEPAQVGYKRIDTTQGVAIPIRRPK